MKLSEYRKIANKYTEKASEITRQLSLGGIAIIWIFKAGGEATSDYSISPFLIWPLLFLSMSLLLDLLQYLIGGITWINFFREKEKETTLNNPDPETKAPEGKNKPLYYLYYIKIGLMILSYFFIIGFLAFNLL